MSPANLQLATLDLNDPVFVEFSLYPMKGPVAADVADLKSRLFLTAVLNTTNQSATDGQVHEMTTKEEHVSAKRTTTPQCSSAGESTWSSGHVDRGLQSVENRAALPGFKNNLDTPNYVDHDERLGVPRGILWGLAISVPLWALLRWALSTL